MILRNSFARHDLRLQCLVRSYALLIDTFIIYWIFQVVYFLPPLEGETPALLDGGIILIIGINYGTLFESSSMQATPGKWFMRISVVTGSEKRIDPYHAFLRNLCKPLTVVSIIGIVMIDLNRKRKSLHDYLAGTMTVRR